MANELGNIAIQVEEKGAEDALSSAGESVSESMGGGEGGDAGGIGGMMGGLVASIKGMSVKMMALVGAAGAILGVLLSMEPIQEMMKGFLKIAQAFLAPVAKMLLRLLTPVMKFLIKLLPKWMEFVSDPVGKIKQALAGLWKTIKKLPQYIGQFLIWLGGKIWAGLKEVPSLIWKLIKGYIMIWAKIGSILWKALQKLGGWLWNKLKAGWDVLKNFGNVIYNKVKDAISWLWDKLKEGVNFIMNLPSKVGEYIADAIPGSDLIGGAAETVGGWFGGGDEGGRERVDVNVSGYNDEETKEVLERSMRRR